LLQDLVSLAVESNILEPKDKLAFEEWCGDMMSRASDVVSLTCLQFVTLLSTFDSLGQIQNLLRREFGAFEILEHHGTSFVKFRVPANKMSAGQVYSVIEEGKPPGVREYSVSETTLEMIFNKFVAE